MSVFGILGDALARGAHAVEPLFGTAATAAAIVLFTLGVRAALHPLARAAARGEKARAALAPQVAALQRTYRGDRERLQQAMADLYAKNGSSPLAGCLPTLLQLPVFFVMYHLFTRADGPLAGHALLAAPLGGTWRQALADGGVFGAQGLVYLALFALIAAVATWNYRRARAAAAAAPAPAANAAPGMAAMSKLMPLLSFGTLITVAVVPLAAGLYMVTTTTWTACERALLHRDKKNPAPSAPEPAPATQPPSPSRSQSQAQPSSSPSAPHGPRGPRPAARRGGPKTRAARQKAARARANTAGRTAASTTAAGPEDRGKGPAAIVTTPQ
ncbi:YidC/Oxa1 family membrane protein insertase [Streptomyces sp. RS10V-4]|uniref:YidC/Oxa1 family membrane protein insertase n=1 Tax=Streptomyces rhizoryzae TaxID=2932493 RepID=UPI0020038C67|nr:YidC/Oxa1 family membrane protein insertase [Streptomyces rhizoryzae]MCK7628220.1 YidC/Oxa1 family membrane protein insertase [Streptomyces rhizoryzae]